MSLRPPSPVPLPSPLPLLDRVVLRSVQRLVPAAERRDWLRSWQAELWYMHHCKPSRRLGILRFALDLPTGLALDAFWLRTHSLRRSFSGTPILCVSSLFALCLLSFVISLASYGGWHALALHLGHQVEHCLVAGPLVLFVSFVIASSSRVKLSSRKSAVRWINHQLFFALKTSLVLLLMFLLSVDVVRPIYVPLPSGADLFQIFFFVLFALTALRWSFHDQEQRCKHCLCSLATPARVGRPSHNLLEWNGTEQICKQGHGHLSVSEMESSWRQYSRWIEQNTAWDQTAQV